MGTTINRLRAAFAALLLRMTAGRVFWISPPTEGSNATHQTSPLRGCIADKSFAPLFCFCFAAGIVRHFAVLSDEAIWRLLSGSASSGLDCSSSIILNDEPSGATARHRIS